MKLFEKATRLVLNTIEMYELKQLFGAIRYEILEFYGENYNLTYATDLFDDVVKVYACCQDSLYIRDFLVAEIPFDKMEWIKLNFHRFIETVESNLDKYVREIMIINENDFIAEKTEEGNPGTWHVMKGSYNKCMEAMAEVISNDEVDIDSAETVGDLEVDGYIQLKYNKYVYTVRIDRKE